MSGNRILDETPSLAKVIKDAIEQRLCDVHTCLPAKIISFDGKKASVQPQLQRKYSDGEIVTLPVISNVPVMWPQTLNAIVILPLKAGDTGTVFFSERSLDKWLVAGGVVNPDDTRKFHLSDAIFYPGVKPFDASSDYDPLRIVIKNKDARLTVKEDGKFKIENTKDSEELLTIIDDFLSAVLAAKVNTALGPQPLVPPTLFTNLQTRLAKLKE